MDDLPAHTNANNANNEQQDSHPHHIVLTDASVNEEEDRERRKAQRNRKFRKAPPWIEAACAILLVLITGFYTFYAARQANAAKKAAMAAFDAAVTAKNTLIEIQKGGTDTHELAVQAKNQADRTKDIAERTLAQATATNILAEQAKRSANIAQRTYDATNRPYVGMDGITISHMSLDANGVTHYQPRKTKETAQMAFSVVIKNFGPIPGSNFSCDMKVFLDGVKLPGTKIADKPNTIYPTETFALSGATGTDSYPNIMNGKSILEIQVRIEYAGPSARYEECVRSHYDAEVNSFLALGDCK